LERMAWLLAQLFFVFFPCEFSVASNANILPQMQSKFTFKKAVLDERTTTPKTK